MAGTMPIRNSVYEPVPIGIAHRTTYSGFERKRIGGELLRAVCGTPVATHLTRLFMNAPAPPPVPIDDASLRSGRLGYLINHARCVVLLAVEEELAPLGVSAAQFIVILGVAHAHARTPSELCRLLGCDSGAMTRLLDRIEAKGIVRRARDLVDRRIVNIELTDKGKVLHPMIMQSVARAHEKLLHRFTDAELKQFQAFLQQIAANTSAKIF
jgi:DNA-binding MarR family transcriptional regulator